MDLKKETQSGHRQRLRRKFLDHGLSKFTDEEIIELLLTFGTPRKDCKQPARELLKKYESIRRIFESRPEELAAVKGVGESNVIALKFIYAVAGKYLEQSLIGKDYLSSSLKVFQYLRHDMENLEKEVFKVIFLDSANGVIGLENCGSGTISSAAVHPREIIERAMALRAAGLVFAHNHPSGKIKPSPDDFRLTRQLLHAAHLVEMRVIDHLIVGKGETYFSFRDEGHLTRYENEIKTFYYSRG